MRESNFTAPSLRNRRDASSTAWRCRFLAARRSQHGGLGEELSRAPDSPHDFRAGKKGGKGKGKGGKKEKGAKKGKGGGKGDKKKGGAKAKAKGGDGKKKGAKKKGKGKKKK